MVTLSKRDTSENKAAQSHQRLLCCVQTGPVWPVPPVMGQIGDWGLGEEIPSLNTRVKHSQPEAALGKAGLSGQP